MATTTQPITPVMAPRRIRGWRFWVPMGLQLLLVLAVPATKVGAFTSGTTLHLAIAPVDPYDLLRGRYMALDYAVESLDTLQKLPGWQAGYAHGTHDLYVTLRPGTAPGQPWQATALSAERPAGLGAGAAIIRGRLKDGAMQLGLREYYMPEDRGDAAEAAIQRSPKSARAELKVDDHGNAVLTGLWIENQRY
ncbi:MAG: GDYXXLXY domain-containing protein [Candidatus Sericytochromatia bacterium]